MTLSRHTRQRVRAIAAEERIQPVELAEIGIILISVMDPWQRFCWRQLARQCDRERQRQAAQQIGRLVSDVWIETYAARICP